MYRIRVAAARTGCVLFRGQIGLSLPRLLAKETSNTKSTGGLLPDGLLVCTVQWRDRRIADRSRLTTERQGENVQV